VCLHVQGDRSGNATSKEVIREAEVADELKPRVIYDETDVRALQRGHLLRHEGGIIRQDIGLFALHLHAAEVVAFCAGGPEAQIHAIAPKPVVSQQSEARRLPDAILAHPGVEPRAQRSQGFPRGLKPRAFLRGKGVQIMGRAGREVARRLQDAAIEIGLGEVPGNIQPARA